MAFRVYDIKRKQWIDNVVKDAQDDLYKVKKGVFKDKLTYLDPNDYIYHDAFNLYDKNNVQVFEGDYLQAEVEEDKFVIGLVAFVDDLSGYAILVEPTQEFYTLGSETTEFIEIIGNVFDGYKEEKKDGKQTLQW